MTRESHPLTVLELGTDPAVAFAGRLLARNGARVVLVEEAGHPRRLRQRPPVLPSDDGALSATAHYVDQGKQSIALGEHVEGAELLTRLTGLADAVLVDRAAWHRHKALWQSSGVPVTVVSPFGLDGPLAERPATAGTVFAMGGEASMLPGGLGFELFPDEPPLLVRGQVVEFDAGVIAALVTAAGIYRALAGGAPAHAEVSKLEVQTSLNRWLVSHYRLSGWVESRETRAYSYGGLMRCSDGYVMLQPATDGHWRGLVAMLGSPEWLLDPVFDTQDGRESRGAEVQRELSSWTGARTRAEVFALGLERGIPVAPFRTIAEVAECEQYGSRDFFGRLDLPQVTARVPGLPYRAHPEARADDRPAPSAGRDTEAVLREVLGLDEQRIAELVAARAVAPTRVGQASGAVGG